MPEPGETTPAVLESPATPARDADFRRRAVFIGLGIVLVAYSYPDTGIGRLPLRFVLENHLGVTPAKMAAFFALANIPSWFKPVIGIFSDSVPIFGTRRRSYLVLAALSGVLVWALMGMAPERYRVFLALAVILNLFCTVCGTVNGAVLFEEGKKYNATGRLASLRSICGKVASIFAGPLAGFLAARAFGLTALTGGILMLLMAGLGIWALREPRTAVRDTEAWTRAKKELLTLARCRPLWIASLLMFLMQIAPGFSTPLFYYQTQTLHFQPQFIGNLEGLAAITGIASGFFYLFWCRRASLMWVLIATTVLHSGITLSFLLYHNAASAAVIEGLNGIGATLAFLALFDLAARATPEGSAAMGYSILYAFINVAISGSDYAGSWLFERFGSEFSVMVWINALTTGVVLFGIPFLPKALLRSRDGDAG